MLVPQGYELKALEPIGHLLAVDPTSTHIGFTFCLECGVLLPVICGIKTSPHRWQRLYNLNPCRLE
nr:hypothetical protein JUJ52_07745 [Virgibacillus sp. AGTR]